MRHRNTAAVAVALVLAGCGGGGTGSSEEAPTNVGSAPPASPAAPDQAPPPPPPAAAAPGVAAPEAPPSPAQESPQPLMLAGTTLKAALDRGVPLSEPIPMSGSVSPGAVAWWTFNKSRVITAPDGSELQVYADLSTVLAAKPYREDTILPVQVRYSRLWLETTPTSVTVTEVVGPVVMPAVAAPIAAALELGKPVGEWRNGEWFVRLVPRTVASQPELFAVCWEYRMPDLDRRAHVMTDAGSEERLLPAGPPLQRVQCSLHRRSDAVDVGATVEEAGVTYTGSWGAP